VNGGANIAVNKSPADAKLFAENEIKKWAVVVKDSGASSD
jgi:hypothetical protein